MGVWEYESMAHILPYSHTPILSYGMVFSATGKYLNIILWKNQEKSQKF